MRPTSDCRHVVRHVPLVMAVVLAIAGAPRGASAVKTDLVILRNHDRITGEVKGLSRGKLDYSTDDAGRLSIEWEKVARVRSPNVYEVEVASGVRHFGSLDSTDTDAFMVVRSARPDTLRITDVVSISPLSAGFVQRLTAYLDVGFTLAKANQATTFNVDGQVDYRGPAIGAAFTYSSYAQGQEGTPTTTRGTIRQSLSWFLPERWTAGGLLQADWNDELNLDHRYTLGGAGGRVLAQSNRMELVTFAGLVGTREQYTASSGAASASATNLEGLLGATWSAFQFDTPKLDFSTTLSLYPSISDAGRVRGQLDLRVKYELFPDFNVGAQLTDTFDSRPPEGASNNDYVTALTIGWSYRR